MRIGILTLPMGHNYGGILQNFALQHILKQLGHKPITFAKGSTYPYKSYLIRKFLKILNLYHYKLPLKPIKGRTTLHRNNWKFINNNIKVSRPSIIHDDNLTTKYHLNAVIVGSDQVWRPDYYRDIEEMFLSFIDKTNNIKRITYAASFGGTEWRFTPEQTKQCAELLKRFDAVSVREKDGIGMCRKYFGVEAKCTLDPTLLVDRKVYEKLCRKIKKPKQQFISAYILDCVDETRVNLERFAARKGMPLKIFSADNKCELSVEQWIATFRDASIVITDSFHGTVFSIIFQKEFFTIANVERGGSRFTSLLSYLDLTHRLFDSANSINFNIPPINWESVTQKLNHLKSESINFLKNALH